MDKQKLVEAYRQMEKAYQDRIEMIWDDMQFDFMMQHGLDDDSMMELEDYEAKLAIGAIPQPDQPAGDA